MRIDDRGVTASGRSKSVQQEVNCNTTNWTISRENSARFCDLRDVETFSLIFYGLQLFEVVEMESVDLGETNYVQRMGQLPLTN